MHIQSREAVLTEFKISLLFFTRFWVYEIITKIGARDI